MIPIHFFLMGTTSILEQVPFYLLYRLFTIDNPPTNIWKGLKQYINFFDTTQLLSGTNYYWTVIPYGVNITAQNCPVWQFTTEDAGFLTMRSLLISASCCL